MKSKKDKLLEKIVKKDYNNELEEVLSTKYFSEEVKNLLLDILYKIETAYSDYEKVKVNVMPKEDYIQNIINIIKNDCKDIKFMNSEESEKNGNKTFIVKKEENKILCLPIARKLLYSLAKIKKSDDIVKSEISLLNRTLTNTLDIGNNINTVEPYRDFNGFSWNISYMEIENFYYNLIYQDLIILVGNQFLEEWTNKNDCMIDYIELFKSYLETAYGKKFSENILELLKNLSVLLEIKIVPKFKTELEIRQTELKEKIDEMSNKVQYLGKISKKKKELAEKIKEIDITLNDNTLLKQEYIKRNEKLPLEEKIFSIKILSKEILKEREKILEQIEECNSLMNPKNYLKKLDLLTKEYKYVGLVEEKDLDKKIFEEIIMLQKQVLKALDVKAEKAETKEELLKVIYEMRYFNLIPVNEENNISKTKELSKVNLLVQKRIIKKAHELKMISNIFCDEKIEAKFFSKIFSLQIISLEDVYFKIKKEKDGYYIQFFDEDIIDEKFKINMEEKNEDNIFGSYKNGNRVKLFS